MRRNKKILILILILLSITYFNRGVFGRIYRNYRFISKNLNLTKDQKLTIKIREYAIVKAMKKKTSDDITLVLPHELESEINKGFIVGLFYPQKVRFIYQ